MDCWAHSSRSNNQRVNDYCQWKCFYNLYSCFTNLIYVVLFHRSAMKKLKLFFPLLLMPLLRYTCIWYIVGMNTDEYLQNCIKPWPLGSPRCLDINLFMFVSSYQILLYSTGRVLLLRRWHIWFPYRQLLVSYFPWYNNCFIIAVFLGCYDINIHSSLTISFSFFPI